MESNRTYHYFLKYSLLGVSILLTGGAIVSWFDPESITVNGKPGSRDISTTLVFGLLAFLAFLLFVLFKDKFAIVEIENDKLNIKHNGDEKCITWREVEEI